jgi:glycosyltransferase involved in cell wall biosynthesis
MSRKLTLVIHALNTGGAERVMCAMANHWAERGDEVTLITLDTVDTDAFFVSPKVRRIGLGLMRESRSARHALRNNLARVRQLRRAMEEAAAELVISFTDKMNVLTLLACLSGPWKVVITERNDPRRQKMGRIWEFLRRRTYPRCRACVVQTEAVAEFARGCAGRRPVYVIPNAVQPPVRVPDVRQRDELIVAMGRLTRQKGFDLLLRAFAAVAGSHPAWKLEILGDGEERDALTSLAGSLDIGDRVRLSGWTEEPEAVLQRAGVFVLSSRYEGFPNALLEAMACGAACLSFACDSGPAEIIRHGVDGLLVAAEDVDGLAASLDRLMRNDEQRRRLGGNATGIVDRFSWDAFFARWDAVLAEAATRSCR